MPTTGFQVNGSDVSNYFVPKDIFSQGQLWGVGLNSSGQLGTNNTTDRSSPIQTVAWGINWKQVSGGSSSTAAIKTDGTLWIWGDNTNGQLGTNDLTSRSSPVQTVAGGTNWKQVASGGARTGAIKTDGTLWMWGNANFGSLGTNDSTTRSSPVQTVAGGTNWKQVALGSNTTAAIKTDGTLWVWGYNFNGQLGTNDTTPRSSPVQTVSATTNWKFVVVGQDHMAGIKTDGTLWVWGNNSWGKLGTGNTTNTSSPVQTVAGGTNWKQVAIGSNNTAGIKTDGTLWLWGINGSGTLGTGDVVDRSSPVQTISGGANWKQVAFGIFGAAIKTDGTLWAWGNNDYGQLGTNNTTQRSSPAQTVAGGSNWKQISCGSTVLLAINDIS